MSNEQDYLKSIALLLDEAATAVEGFDTDELDVDEIKPLLQSLLEKEVQLRTDLGVGSRFLVLQTQLKQLCDKVNQLDVEKQRANQDEVDFKSQAHVLKDDEAIVFVYLYNAHGAYLSTWEKLLSEKALNEHSVNRPVYAHEDDVDVLLRNKNHLENHAIIEAKINKEFITLPAGKSSLRDIHGGVLLRLQQGALKPHNILHLRLNGKVYQLNHQGKLFEI